MEIIAKNIDDIIILQLVGRLESVSVEEFNNTIRILTEHDHKHFVVDLSRVEFIDSSGLGAFVTWKRKLDEKNGDIRLACLTESSRHVIELTRLHRLFDIFEDSDSAVQSFR